MKSLEYTSLTIEIFYFSINTVRLSAKAGSDRITRRPSVQIWMAPGKSNGGENSLAQQKSVADGAAVVPGKSYFKSANWPLSPGFRSPPWIFGILRWISRALNHVIG